MKVTPATCFHLTVDIVREIHAEAISGFGGSDGFPNRDLALMHTTASNLIDHSLSDADFHLAPVWPRRRHLA